MSISAIAQKKNINAAWRALTDYQSTLNDTPNLSYLLKAKESIDMAIQNPETKEDARALTYHSQIYFELFKYYQNHIDPTIQHHTYLKNAIETYDLLKEKHPKIAATTELQTHGINLLNTSNQAAVQLFNEKKYNDASQFFEQHSLLQKKILNTLDTAGLFNAFLSAYKAHNEERIIKLSNELIQTNLDNVKLFQLMYSFYQHKNDTVAARNILKKGREKYPNDLTLLNQETEYYISSKQYLPAIQNLQLLIQKDTTNALLLLTLGNIYDNLANQNMAAKNYSDSTENLFQKSIQYYMKSYVFKSQLDAENLFTLTYNIGAYYTNYGLFYYNKKMKEFKITDLSQKQKGVEDKRKEYTQMGLPYLKEAETLKPNDASVIAALYKVYALIGDTKNAEVYKNKMIRN